MKGRGELTFDAQVVMDPWLIVAGVADLKAAVHNTTDSVTGERWCEVYTNDGTGTGVLLFRVQLPELKGRTTQ